MATIHFIISIAKYANKTSHNYILLIIDIFVLIRDRFVIHQRNG